MTTPSSSRQNSATPSCSKRSSRRPSSSVLPTPADKARVVEEMFDRIAPTYERVNRIIALGLDGSWRRRAVAELRLPTGSRVLDLACGTGDLCRLLAGSGYDALGVDISAAMLANARGELRLVRADVMTEPFRDQGADGITCGFALRNIVDVDAFLVECARVLRPGGRISFVDAAEPRSALARAGHRLWFKRAVPWIGGRLSHPPAYRYLAESTAYLPGDAPLVSITEQAGFVDVDLRSVTFGAVRLLTGTRKRAGP
jgi:demethylmenaquinone methyltransferase / 2-methoxy-6-polyprenyl-1,4-benzoquinol methylase